MKSLEGMHGMVPSRLSLTLIVMTFGGWLSIPSTHAASCCGGGGGSALVLPKFSKAMAEISSDFEKYNGFWNMQGDYLEDPAGSDLRQYRMSLGIAARLASRWQMGLVAPYVWNDNRYTGMVTESNGAGDMALNVWYETFDGITCVSKVRSLQDLKPAIYLGSVLTIPTGISPYDADTNSMDITGLGFYRLDGILLLEKTVYPFNASFLFSYGTHLERSVNREYGKFIEPYDKKLGDKALGSFSFGYTYFLESMQSLTIALAFSHLWEGEGKLNGSQDPTTGFEKNSFGVNLSYSTVGRDWVVRSGWNHGYQRNDWGRSFPATDIFSLGVSRVFL